MFIEYIVGLSGLIAAGLFIYGLKAMSSPVTAVSGIVTAGYGMVFVVGATFLNLFNVSPDARPHLLVNVALAVVALLLGCLWTGWRGRTVQMTAMPQMVAIF
ncbi:NAD(P) transhydrogenase subunit beta [Acetobacter ghanensis]|nr:NAD(P) transhydrogenase subunit beta [Acetobacter ghanensis]